MKHVHSYTHICMRRYETYCLQICILALTIGFRISYLFAVLTLNSDNTFLHNPDAYFASYSPTPTPTPKSAGKLISNFQNVKKRSCEAQAYAPEDSGTNEEDDGEG